MTTPRVRLLVPLLAVACSLAGAGASSGALGRSPLAPVASTSPSVSYGTISAFVSYARPDPFVSR